MRIERRIPAGYNALAALGIALLSLAGCAPMQGGTKDFRPLGGGGFENTGGVIEQPGAFRIVGGQNFTTPFSIDCTSLSADAGGWQAALAAGARKVVITLPGEPRYYGGVLALCNIHKSATGPSSRSYSIVIPASKIPDAQDGLIASVAEQVTVNRQGPIDLAAVLATPAYQAPTIPVITEDFAWMLWFSDRPSVFGINFAPTGAVMAPPSPPPSAPSPPAPPPIPSPTLTKGGSYTVTTALNLRAGPGVNNPVVTLLNPGDALVATGEEKNGFWAVTTVGGQTGWVSPHSLKAN